jgi:hypothetical protein
VWWYKNGQKALEGQSIKAFREGTWIAWYPSGQRRSVTEYHHGRAHGARSTWYSDGTKRGESSYHSGELHGPFSYFYENGLEELRGRARHGQACGAQFCYTPSGEPEPCTDLPLDNTGCTEAPGGAVCGMCTGNEWKDYFGNTVDIIRVMGLGWMIWVLAAFPPVLLVILIVVLYFWTRKATRSHLS